MPITVTCGGCSAALKVADAAAGKRAKCPKCSRPFTVPLPPPAPAVPSPPPPAPTAVAGTTALSPAVRPPAFEAAPAEPPDTRDCPYCGESIKAVAVKCKHCGERFGARWATDPPPIQHPPPERPDPEPERPRPRPPRRGRDEEADWDDEPVGRRRSSCTKAVYVLIALFFGGWGIHNFYAGRTGPALIQLLLWLCNVALVALGFCTAGVSLVPAGIGLSVSLGWVLIDIVTVNRDGRGRAFR